MEIAQIKAFLVLAEEGHMTRTAGKLHLTQPAVSAQLSRLEEALGQSLFDRTPRGMVLTEAGYAFLPYAREAIARLDDGRLALQQIRGLQQGALAIGGGATAITYVLPGLISQFHSTYPGIRFFVREQPSQSVVEDVISGTLDLGIVTLPIKMPVGHVSSTIKLEVEEWVEDELLLLVPSQHLLEGQKSFQWSELDGSSLVLFEAGSAVRALIDRQIEDHQIDVDIVMELRSIESIKQMVAHGIGAAFVSRYALRQGEYGLRCIATPLRRQLAIVYRGDRTQSVAAQVFLEMMRKHRNTVVDRGSTTNA